jgi:glutamine amidotransferase
MIVVVNYGMGNMGSIVNMLKKLNVSAKISADPNEIMDARKVILPGVGSYDNAVLKLKDLNLFEVLRNKGNQPDDYLLGICLGMQLLGTDSEEGIEKGLNLIPGSVKEFKSEMGLKVPHMGWNEVSPIDKQVFENLDENRFYFVHSYYFNCVDKAMIAGQTKYGIEFTSTIRKGNIIGAQFHPEKSHKFGMQFLSNFSKL